MGVCPVVPNRYPLVDICAHQAPIMRLSAPIMCCVDWARGTLFTAAGAGAERFVARMVIGSGNARCGGYASRVLARPGERPSQARFSVNSTRLAGEIDCAGACTRPSRRAAMVVASLFGDCTMFGDNKLQLHRRALLGARVRPRRRPPKRGGAVAVSTCAATLDYSSVGPPDPA